MVKTILIVLSVTLNLIFTYVALIALSPESSKADSMNCDQSSTSAAAAHATMAYAEEKNYSFSEVHNYLTASGFDLRNITNDNREPMTLVYASNFSQIKRCRTFFEIDERIVAVNTSASSNTTVDLVRENSMNGVTLLRK